MITNYWKLSFILIIIIIIIPPPNEVGGGYTEFTLSVRPSVRPYVCRRHGFRSISQVCFGILISNFICMLMMAIGRSLLIFSNVTFQMAAWQPYWIFWFPDSNFTLALNINFKLQRHNCWFSATSFSKWPPGGHIGFFGSGLCRWHGFRSVSQVCFGISISNFICFSLAYFSLVWNINSKHKWHNTYIYG